MLLIIFFNHWTSSILNYALLWVIIFYQKRSVSDGIDTLTTQPVINIPDALWSSTSYIKSVSFYMYHAKYIASHLRLNCRTVYRKIVLYQHLFSVTLFLSSHACVYPCVSQYICLLVHLFSSVYLYTTLLFSLSLYFCTISLMQCYFFVFILHTAYIWTVSQRLFRTKGK